MPVHRCADWYAKNEKNEVKYKQIHHPAKI